MLHISRMSIPELKQCIRRECRQVPLSQVTSVGGKKSRKKGASHRATDISHLHNIRSSLQEDGSVLVSNPHDVATIYTSGCFGKGTLSKGAPFGCFDGSEDLVLSPAEACYLLLRGCIEVLREEEKVSVGTLWEVWVEGNSEFPEQYVVYCHFRRKGYTVRSAVKYGGDFMLYTGDPSNSHAAYIASVVTSDPQVGGTLDSVVLCKVITTVPRELNNL